MEDVTIENEEVVTRTEPAMEPEPVPVTPIVAPADVSHPSRTQAVVIPQLTRAERH